jgi:hypothetical protein
MISEAMPNFSAQESKDRTEKMKRTNSIFHPFQKFEETSDFSHDFARIHNSADLENIFEKTFSENFREVPMNFHQNLSENDTIC